MIKMDGDFTYQISELPEEALNYFVDQVRLSGRYRITPISDPSDHGLVLPNVTEPSIPSASQAFPSWCPPSEMASQPPLAPPPSFIPPPGTRSRPSLVIQPDQTYAIPQPAAPNTSFSHQYHSTPAPHAFSVHRPPPPPPTPNQTFVNPRPYVLNSNAKVPKLPEFCGETKGDEFDIWVYEVNCLMQSNQYSNHLIMEAVRRSLKGRARSVLLSLGESATLRDIMDELEGLYGNVASSEKLKERFYSACQEPGETVAEYSLRLEQLLRHSSAGLDYFTKNEMLSSRLWSGLRNETLKNVSRYKYESIRDFNELRKELRKIEQDIEKGKKVEEKESVQSETVESKVETRAQEAKKAGSEQESENVSVNMTTVEHRLLKQMQELSDQFKKMNSRMGNIEKELKDVKKSNGKGQGNRWNRNKPPNQTFNRNSQEKPKTESLNDSRPPSQGQ